VSAPQIKGLGPGSGARSGSRRAFLAGRGGGGESLPVVCATCSWFPSDRGGEGKPELHVAFFFGCLELVLFLALRFLAPARAGHHGGCSACWLWSTCDIWFDLKRSFSSVAFRRRDPPSHRTKGLWGSRSKLHRIRSSASSCASSPGGASPTMLRLGRLRSPALIWWHKGKDWIVFRFLVKGPLYKIAGLVLYFPTL
jgi:hypothetical protein